MRRTLILWVTLLCIFFLGNVAEAKGWPGGLMGQPAGGKSASGDPELLLTFDDGPHKKNTIPILNALKKHGHQAIFFWMSGKLNNDAPGQTERLALIDRAVREGHLIGNHTISHPKLCTIRKERAEREMDKNAAVYEKLSRLPMLLFRAPYGAKCRRLERMLAQRSISHLHWDIDPQEFLHHSSDIAFSHVVSRLRRLQNGRRAVLLMHDTKTATARALPRILDWIATENDKRKASGRRPIRVIKASSFVREQFPMPLLEWGSKAGKSADLALQGAVAKLIGNALH